jgi:hypothetical protein
VDLELPFLIEHGWWLWIAAMAAISSAVWAGVAVGRRSRARRELRGVMDRVRAWHPREGEVIVRGVLGAGAPGVVIARIHTDGEAEQSFEWQREAWIETDDGKVQLADEVMMLAGAMSAARFGVPRRTPDAMLKQHIALHRPQLGASIQWATLTALATGDEVIARGRIERRPKAAGGDYREGPHVALLHAMGETDTRDAWIEIAATAPRAVPRPMRLRTVVTLAVAAPLAVFLGIHVAGGRSVEACRDQISEHIRDRKLLELEATGACAIAAAAPSKRGKVLEALSSYRSAAACALARAELASARLDEAAAAAARCSSDLERTRVLVASGRFAEAAEPDRGLLWIAAGRWQEAALSAEAKLTVLAEGNAPNKLAYGRCFVELLRHRAGYPDAAGRLRQYLAATGETCAAFAVQLAAPEERVELLRRAAPAQALPDARFKVPLLDALRWRHGLAASELLQHLNPAYGLATLGQDYRIDLQPALVALLSRRVADPPASRPLQRILTLEWRAVGSVLAGDLAAATVGAKQAAELRVALDPSAYPDVDLSARLLAVLQRFGAAPGGQDVGELDIDASRFRPAFLPALQQAAEGDGAALADVLADPDLWWQDARLLAIAPRLVTDRDRVRDALARRLPSDLVWLDPLVLASVAVVRERLFQVLGAPEIAARWRRIADALLAAVDDEDRLFAMWAWAELGW